MWTLLKGLLRRLFGDWTRMTGNATRSTPSLASTYAADVVGESPMLAAVAALAPVASGLAEQREPEDFMLAARLRSVAVLNVPSARKQIVERTRVPAKRQSKGLLSPIAARRGAAMPSPSAPFALQLAA